MDRNNENREGFKGEISLGDLDKIRKTIPQEMVFQYYFRGRIIRG